MKTEKIVLSFIAILIGLLVAGIAFFIYQSTKIIPSSKLPKITINSSSPTPPPGIFLSIDQPANDESVVDSKTLTISGSTSSDATIILDTPTDDQVITPASNGNYSITTTIGSGENKIIMTAVNAKGEEITKTFTITYSTEDF